MVLKLDSIPCYDLPVLIMNRSNLTIELCLRVNDDCHSEAQPKNLGSDNQMLRFAQHDNPSNSLRQSNKCK